MPYVSPLGKKIAVNVISVVVVVVVVVVYIILTALKVKKPNVGNICR
tara:strand:+ start:182 stop:322 length:141 start_codon:yes stop_codon:yes gene_type:complete